MSIEELKARLEKGDGFSSVKTIQETSILANPLPKYSTTTE
jgi:hypothetical protein